MPSFSKSRALPFCTLVGVAAWLLSAPSCGFLSTPQSSSRVDAGQGTVPAAATVGALMLAGLPLPVYANSMLDSDFGASLSFLAAASLFMIAILSALHRTAVTQHNEQQVPPVVVAAALQAARSSSADDKEPKEIVEPGKFYTLGMQGYRDYMEDYTIAVPALPNSPNAGLYAVFDGHGGFKVAQLCAELLPEIIDSTMQKCDTPEAALQEAFKIMDEKLLKLGVETKQEQTSASVSLRSKKFDHIFGYCGCTACVALVLKEANSATRVLCANCGDSRAVLSKAGAAIDLSTDHNPQDKEEYDRITAAGGKVERFGPCYRINAGLNLSRAFGDFAYKPSNLPREKGMVISVPEIQEFILDSRDEFMVIGSDGIWNAMESQSVVDSIRFELNQGYSMEDVTARCLQRCLASYDNVSLCMLQFSGQPAARL